MTTFTDEIGLQVAQIAMWIDERGNQGTEIETLTAAGLPVAVLENSRACDGIVFYTSGSSSKRSSRSGVYRGWYVRKDPYWVKTWASRFSMDGQAGNQIKAWQVDRELEQHKPKRHPKLTSWQKELINMFTDKVRSAAKAHRLIMSEDLVILDTETTGLSNAWIVSLAVIDKTGRVLIDTLLDPQCPSSEGAVNVHGIEDWQVVGAPFFSDVYPALCELTKGKHLVIYNSAFDLGVLQDEVDHWKLETHDDYVVLPVIDSSCAMLLYSQFYGEWHERKGDYRWQSLATATDEFKIRVQAPAHSALGDCLRTLEVLRSMSDWYIRLLEMRSCLKQAS